MLSFDLLGPLPRSSKDYEYILLICEYFSRFVLSIPSRNATVPKILEYLENEVFWLFGVPQYLIGDNGVQFKSKKFIDSCKK